MEESKQEVKEATGTTKLYSANLVLTTIHPTVVRYRVVDAGGMLPLGFTHLQFDRKEFPMDDDFSLNFIDADIDSKDFDPPDPNEKRAITENIDTIHLRYKSLKRPRKNIKKDKIPIPRAKENTISSCSVKFSVSLETLNSLWPITIEPKTNRDVNIQAFTYSIYNLYLLRNSMNLGITKSLA